MHISSKIQFNFFYFSISGNIFSDLSRTAAVAGCSDFVSEFGKMKMWKCNLDMLLEPENFSINISKVHVTRRSLEWEAKTSKFA